ncbi:MAG TPA: hypothetical protein VMK12_02800 [Anaeromyxobacteraceae bacterium]|nr:hypothetical protein [Anaeromyxobacteraceae bacterium]
MTALAVGLLFALPVTPRDSAEPLDGAEGAALAALRGDSVRAREILQEDETEGPATLVVLASLALEEGNFGEAGRFTERLRLRHPAAAEGSLLAALLVERQAQPFGDWTGPAIAALGRYRPLAGSMPALRFRERWQSAWLAGRLPVPETQLTSLTAREAFLVRWAWPRQPLADVDPAIEEAAVRLADEDSPLVVQLALLDTLRTAFSARAAVARKTVVERLRVKKPGAARLLALDAWRDSGPLSADEVGTIEAAAAGGDPAPFGLLYGDLLRVLEKIDPASAPGLAMGGAMRLTAARHLPVGLSYRLAQKPALPAAARARLAGALSRLAELAERQGAMFSDILALASLSQAVALGNDVAPRARADRIYADLVSLRAASLCLSPLRELPIRSLQRALGAAQERALLERVRAVGLRCAEPTAFLTRRAAGAAEETDCSTQASPE